jgi:acyl-coenzyme A thioesterase THEM4
MGRHSQLYFNPSMSVAIEHFSKTPWVRALIEDPAWTPTRTASRVPKATSEDSFFAETLGTNRTIRHCLTLRPAVSEADGPEFRHVLTIIDLGDGLNGHPKICHGGFVATMLDEVCGVLLMLNLERKDKEMKEKFGPLAKATTFTACQCSTISHGAIWWTWRS